MTQYIVRLDDACPTMNSENWDMFEVVLDELNICPIVGVIPNNMNENLRYEKEDEFFWQKVRRWQDKGWHIALHGFDHKYITKGSGLVPINKKSEFVGLPQEIQKNKIKNGIEIFEKNKIKCDIWVAPSHAFDGNTLKALKEETSISIISDGLAKFPFTRFGFFWIPQQLWKYKERRDNGIYTICYHPSMMNKNAIKKELYVLSNSQDNFCHDFGMLKKIYESRKYSFLDIIYEKKFLYRREVVNLALKLFRN